ncbi:MAG TPA: phosphatase PAP2 family protein [Micromonosporaceae bacterium]|nr:phosphatase PAP2 family protein [Micromonosporaceae bacterium]
MNGKPRSGSFVSVLLVAGFVALTIALDRHYLIGVDVAVADWCDAHRPPALYWLARVLNYLGNGGPLAGLCALVAAWRGVRGRTVRPVLLVVFAFVLSFVVIMPIKIYTWRLSPRAELPDVPNPVEMFGHPAGRSYPSGHLVNAIVWYGVLAMLLAPWLTAVTRRILRVVPPVVLTVTTVYLSFHWLTDTVAGLMLGLVLYRIIASVPWDDLPLGRRLAKAGWDRPFLS